jgi:hypothetical protein
MSIPHGFQNAGNDFTVSDIGLAAVGYDMIKEISAQRFLYFIQFKGIPYNGCLVGSPSFAGPDEIRKFIVAHSPILKKPSG